jgi:hypothetical protein
MAATTKENPLLRADAPRSRDKWDGDVIAIATPASDASSLLVERFLRLTVSDPLPSAHLAVIVNIETPAFVPVFLAILVCQGL